MIIPLFAGNFMLIKSKIESINETKTVYRFKDIFIHFFLVVIGFQILTRDKISRDKIIKKGQVL